METSLHRQLKQQYADSDDQTEVSLGRYRIDVVRDEVLIEIQHGALAAIRSKIARLLRNHQVLVVKPIIERKTLVKRAAQGRKVLGRRLSPKKGSILDLFGEMVHFCRVFPHENLTLEVPLVEVEEWRFPGHGRRRWRRKDDFQVEDQRLVRIGQVYRFATASDFTALLPKELPTPFDTQTLAESMGVARRVAQQMAYSLREMEGISLVGKRGNSLLYDRAAASLPNCVARAT